MPILLFLMGPRCSLRFTIRLTRSMVFARAAFFSSWGWVRSCSPCWLRFGAGWLELPRLCHCLAWALTAGGSTLWFFSPSSLPRRLKPLQVREKEKCLGRVCLTLVLGFGLTFFVPQVAAAGCAAAAVVDRFFQGISSLLAAAFLARALISFFASGILFLFTSGNVLVLFAMIAGSSRLEVILFKGNGKMLECFLRFCTVLRGLLVEELGAGWHTLQWILRAACSAEMAGYARCFEPFRRRGHVLGLRFGRGPAWCFVGTVRSFLLPPSHPQHMASTMPGSVELFEAGRSLHNASQAEASPRVDVGEVSQAPGDKAARSFKDQNSCTKGGSNKGCFFVTVLSGKTLTMTAPLDSSVSSLVHDLSSITCIPVEKFYLVVAGRVLNLDSSLSQAGIGCDVSVRMCFRLNGGVKHEVLGSWTCMVCNMGGCWPVRQNCFRCGLFGIQGHLSLLVVRCGIRVEARVDRSAMAIQLLDSRGRSLGR